ncbi:MAG TPA: adenylate/guanylate cyclase domain-containing protein [Actinomycetota bacterium]
MRTPIEYARSGELFIAYQVIGEGPFDLLLALPFMGHLELWSTWPPNVRSLEALSSFCRLILYDRRGTGLSDRLSPQTTFEDSMDDIRAVLDAAGSERASLFGMAEGGPLCALFAATYPERTSALVLYGTWARMTQGPDYPWGYTPERNALVLETYERKWGREPVGIGTYAPSMANDERFREWILREQRNAVSPGAAIAWWRVQAEGDVRNVLPTIRVPTLVLHRRDDRLAPVESGRYVAEHIPGAKFVELEGDDHLWSAGNSDAIIEEVQEFLTGSRRVTEADRVLATVLITDIVGSTARATALGDRAWRDVLESYFSLSRAELERFRGREVKTVGDGVLATFDGPARAIRSAVAMREAARGVGIEIRAGLHTGECEVMGEDVAGIAVHIAARVAATASPGEVLVSGTVKDLVAGSGIEFADRGLHALKGIAEERHLFSVEV